MGAGVSEQQVTWLRVHGGILAPPWGGVRLQPTTAERTCVYLWERRRSAGEVLSHLCPLFLTLCIVKDKCMWICA